MTKKMWTTDEVAEIGQWHGECQRLEAEYAARYAGSGSEWDAYDREYRHAEVMLNKSLRSVLRRIDRGTDTIAEYERLETALWADIDANN